MARDKSDLNPAQRLIVESLHRWSEAQAANGVHRDDQVAVIDTFRKVYNDLGPRKSPGAV